MVSLVNIVRLLLALYNTLTAYPDGDKHDNDGVSVCVSWRKYKTYFENANPGH